MLFGKNVVAAIGLLLSVSLQAHAHTVITPMLGVKGAAQRSDTQRPTDAKPCGDINVANNIDSSSAVQLGADGTFEVSIQNFNLAADGSRHIDQVKVDHSGTGNNFVAADVQMVTNGIIDTKELKAVKHKVKMTGQCNGGKDKNKCLVTFKTTRGFGNCVVVQDKQTQKAARELVVGTRAARAMRLVEESG